MRRNVLLVLSVLSVGPLSAVDVDRRVVTAGDFRALVPSVEDIRPSRDGRTALFCSGADGFGEIDLDAKAVIWRRPFDEGLRSIAGLPGGQVAVSTRSGRIVVSTRAGEESEVAAPGVCGLLWDERRSCLWAVARTNLLQYALNAGRLSEKGRWDYRVAWRDTGAGDISSDGGDGLYLSTTEALLHFDPATESFSLARLERDIRSYSASRDRGDLMSLGDESVRRWRVADPYLPSPPADNRCEEIRRANRTSDAYPALIDFEREGDWAVSVTNAVATFTRAQDRQMFGAWTGRLSYRGVTNGHSSVRFRPRAPQPLPAEGWDSFTVWIHGTRFGRGANTDPETPRPDLRLNLLLADGTARVYWLANPDWKNWFPVHLRFPAKDLEELRRKGARFDGFTLEGTLQPDDRILHFDNIAFFTERFGPLALERRPQRNLRPLKGANLGLNTGPGRLPFPVREETILPPSPVGGASPAPAFRLAAALGPAPERLEISSRRVGKTLIVDFYAPAGAVTGIVSAAASEGRRTGSFAVPFMAYGTGRDQKPLVDVLDGKYFRVAQFDWYRSNASAHIWQESAAGRMCGVRYLPKTDGTYNDLSERLFITVSDSLDDVMPTIPNPPSPWRGEVGARGWRNHGSSFRSEDRKLWQAIYDHGIRKMTVTDHETCWRDGGDSYTYRTHAAPAKGGDAAMLDYSRFMRERLGFRYGPYNNYVELAPVNGNWSWVMVARWPGKQPIAAWVRTYATKASMAPYWSAKIATELHGKYGFNTAYCDVHTAAAPWRRVDYDARVPGAGTVSEVFYAWGETLLAQRKAWGGPVFSEGGFQCMYAGLGDGNYARDATYDFATEPWILDFALTRIHPLEIDIGMGSLRHFSPSKDNLQRRYHRPSVRTVEEAEPLLDRYICAELAFGHAGYLIIDWFWNPAKTYGPSYGEPCTFNVASNPAAWRIAARSHFMTLAIARRHSTAAAERIRYLGDDGRWLGASDAIRTGAVARNQLAVRYDNGLWVVVNANGRERLRSEVGGVALDLPPSGYRAWTEDGATVAESSDRDGHRYDYCASPEYVYLDGRGHFVEMPRARGAGAHVTLLEGAREERIMFWDAEGK